MIDPRSFEFLTITLAMSASLAFTVFVLDVLLLREVRGIRLKRWFRLSYSLVAAGLLIFFFPSLAVFAFYGALVCIAVLYRAPQERVAA